MNSLRQQISLTGKSVSWLTLDVSYFGGRGAALRPIHLHLALAVYGVATGGFWKDDRSQNEQIEGLSASFGWWNGDIQEKYSISECMLTYS